jgi:hypothetical protein
MKNAGAPAVKREAEEDWGRSVGDERGAGKRPNNDGTYVVEFMPADGEPLAISVPRNETAVLKHFQERMPYGLFVPDVP